MPKRVLTVSAIYDGATYRGYQELPFIRLRGKWLQDLGFGIGQKITVEASEEQLILRVLKED